MMATTVIIFGVARSTAKSTIASLRRPCAKAAATGRGQSDLFKARLGQIAA
ncbi:MAG: hypothetical protein WAV18_19325 [Roseiarcus sp.]